MVTMRVDCCKCCEARRTILCSEREYVNWWGWWQRTFECVNVDVVPSPHPPSACVVSSICLPRSVWMNIFRHFSGVFRWKSNKKLLASELTKNKYKLITIDVSICTHTHTDVSIVWAEHRLPSSGFVPPRAFAPKWSHGRVVVVVVRSCYPPSWLILWRIIFEQRCW